MRAGDRGLVKSNSLNSAPIKTVSFAHILKNFRNFEEC